MSSSKDSNGKDFGSRYFNRVMMRNDINGNPVVVLKYSSNVGKLKAESEWYASAAKYPIIKKHILPSCVFEKATEEEPAHLTMPYVGKQTLADDFMSMDSSFQAKLFEVIDFIFYERGEGKRFDNHKRIESKQVADYLYYDKIIKRCQWLFDKDVADKLELCAFDFKVSGKRIYGEGAASLTAYDIFKFIKVSSEYLVSTLKPGVMHGDLCFSNVVTAPFGNGFMLIDPRGSFVNKAGDEVYTCLGDPRYDMAKLLHSFCDFYDFVKADRFSILKCTKGGIYDPCKLMITLDINAEESFRDFYSPIFMKVANRIAVFGHLNMFDLMYIRAGLFLSMLPLHKDRPMHQHAFFVIAASLVKSSIDNLKREGLWDGVDYHEEYDMLCKVHSITKQVTRATIVKVDDEKPAQEPLRICFDIDGVICNVKKKHESYDDCVPNKEVIKIINELHDAGHTIIINTARSMQSHGQCVGGAIKAVGMITLQQLGRWGVKYDEIYFGKPNAHITIDDRCLRFDGKLTKEEILCAARQR